MSKPRLGGGISSLLGDINHDDFNDKTKTSVQMLALSKIKPNPNQVRKYFDEASLKELAISIKNNGIIQPIVVEPADNGFYSIIAGERRYRASKIAELNEVPVVIKTITDSERLVLALLENIQREDLKPIEEAKAYQDLINILGLTHAELGEKLGKSRSAISNSLRLLDLDDGIKKDVDDGLLSAGHARALLAVENKSDRQELATKISNSNLSVRDVENLIKVDKNKFSKSNLNYTKELLDLENELKSYLPANAKPKLRGTKESGSLTINFETNEELAKLIKLIKN